MESIIFCDKYGLHEIAKPKLNNVDNALYKV